MRGTLAAAVGTAAMDLLWYVRYKRGGGESDILDWEFSVGLNDWEKASAPAKMGKRLYEALLQRQLSAEHAALTNNVMHWGYGLTWGALFGLVEGSQRRVYLRHGLLFGPFVWATSYVVLPLAGLYKPIWEYDLDPLWQDLSAHLTYGLGTAVALRALLPEVRHSH